MRAAGFELDRRAGQPGIWINAESNDFRSAPSFFAVASSSPVSEIVDEKTVVFAFGAVYAPWQSLFSAVMPKHVLEDQPFNAIWDELITVGSGPFVMTEWVLDERITLTRNPDYWASEDTLSGSPLGDVQTINVVFLEDSQTQIQALRLPGAVEEATILYIEDNLANLSLVETIFDDRPSMQFIPALQGRLGLELARQHAPHLILLDLHMPLLDGFAVMREIERRLPDERYLPIL